MVLCLATQAQQPARQQNQTQAAGPTTFRAGTNEVLLDFVVRDKHQKVVKDLTAADVQVLENGVPQKILSFTYRGGNLQEAQQSERTAPGMLQRYDPTRALNVVPIAYHTMSVDGMRTTPDNVRAFFITWYFSSTYICIFPVG